MAFARVGLRVPCTYRHQGKRGCVVSSEWSPRRQNLPIRDIVELQREIRPAESRGVFDESVDLPLGTPDRWRFGWAFRGVMSDFRGVDDTAVPGALRRGSVRLRHGDRELVVVEDYLIDEDWGVATGVHEFQYPVCASYEFGLLRIDSLVAVKGGAKELLRGLSHLSNPYPPTLLAHQTLIANIYVPYFGEPEILWLNRHRSDARSPSQRSKLPRTTDKLATGSSLRVTCMGDSVTAGASSSSTESAYPRLLEEAFRSNHYSGVTINTVAVAGSNSAQWLGRQSGDTGVAWAEVIDSKPDLLIVEFVNDADIDGNLWQELYSELTARSSELNCDLLITTPHFTRPEWMGNERMSDPDRRPYVRFLRQFCRDQPVALADVASAWERLYDSGIPYLTLLRNGINHPDDRGHRIYATEVAATIGLNPNAPRRASSAKMPTQRSA